MAAVEGTSQLNNGRDECQFRTKTADEAKDQIRFFLHVPLETDKKERGAQQAASPVHNKCQWNTATRLPFAISKESRDPNRFYLFVLPKTSAKNLKLHLTCCRQTWIHMNRISEDGQKVPFSAFWAIFKDSDIN